MQTLVQTLLYLSYSELERCDTLGAAIPEVVNQLTIPLRHHTSHTQRVLSGRREEGNIITQLPALPLALQPPKTHHFTWCNTASFPGHSQILSRSRGENLGVAWERGYIRGLAPISCATVCIDLVIRPIFATFLLNKYRCEI